MKPRPLVMYLGGFAPVGGIEAFARDFLLAIADAYPERELVIWGSRSTENVLLGDIARSGAKISGSPWRWGCAWRMPDYVLAPIGRSAVQRAAAVIFKRPPPPAVLGYLRRSAQATGRRIPFILITPYRPLEYWGPSPDLGFLANFDVIAVQSEDGRLDLETSGYRGRIVHIPLLPPDTAAPVAFPARSEPGLFRLGFLGRLAAQKNVRYLLDVYRQLALGQGGLRYELHLFGDGEQREELERRRAELGLSGVTFHGMIPRAEVARAIDSCDLFLNTSVTEGQCLVALEVLSRGRPLVATPVGALPEILREAELGRLAPLDDPAAYANTVAEVARRISDGAITPESVVTSFRRRYDHAAIVNRYLDLLASELTGAAAPVGSGAGVETAPASVSVSIMITTKNRLEDLRRTCAVLRTLSPPPLEIIITADGCTDGTVDFVRSEMPQARLIVNEVGRGSVVSRDRMIREARGDYILSLDDDSHPEQHDFLARIPRIFEQRPAMAVLHFPQRSDEYPATLGAFDFGPPRVTRSFSSAGAVLRRSTYLRLRGFEPCFFHVYEEPDYGLQCCAAGHEVFFEPSLTVRHRYTGTGRNEMRNHHRHARNELLGTLLRVPFPYVVPMALYRVLSQFRYACARGVDWMVHEPVWWLRALACVPHCLRERRTVRWADYRRWLRLAEVDYTAGRGLTAPRPRPAPVETAV